MSNGLINQPALYESSNIPEEKKERLRVIGTELAIGDAYDRIDASYPSPTQEVYTYSKNGNTVLTVQVNYLTSSKKDLDSVVVV